MDYKKYLPFILIGGIGLIVIIALSNSIFLTIQPGETGIILKCLVV